LTSGPPSAKLCPPGSSFQLRHCPLTLSIYCCGECIQANFDERPSSPTWRNAPPPMVARWLTKSMASASPVWQWQCYWEYLLKFFAIHIFSVFDNWTEVPLWNAAPAKWFSRVETRSRKVETSLLTTQWLYSLPGLASVFSVSSGKASAALSLVLCSKKYWTDVRVLVTVTIWKRFLRANQALSSVCTPRPLRLSHQSNQFHQCRLPCDNQSVHGQIVFTGQVARVRLPRRDSACYGKIVLWSCFTDHVTWICSFRTTPNMFLAHCDEAVQ